MTLLPRNETEAAEIIRTLTAPVQLQGGGTRGVHHPAPKLSSAALTGVRLYEPGALTLVVAAGTPLEEVEALAAQNGQRLPFEPYDSRPLLGTTGTPTIGGVVAANLSGPARVTAGAARDFLLGLRYIDGEGRLIANGGRVMKNVTGYDLSRLLAGSHGTLGFITEVALKLLPTPEQSTTLTLENLSAQDAIAAMSSALGSSYEVNGAAYVAGKTHLRLEGFSASVAYRAQKLAAHLAPFGTAHIAASGSLWRKIRDVETLRGKGDLWCISCRPSEAAVLLAKTTGDVQLDWGGARIWVRSPEGFDLRKALGEFDGHSTCLRGPFARFTPEAPATAALARALRQKFDPQGRFAPGLMD